jgi:hypothetical protein
VADTDGDGFDDGVEVSRGSDPLSPDSAPANVRLDNATTPRGDVFVGDEGFVGRLLSELGNTLSAPIAWVGRGGVPGSEFGCDTTPADLVLTDLAVPYGEKVRGKIALIERGTCFFTTKVALAESHGAVGVIIYNNAGDGVISMGVPAGWSVPIGIPAIFIGQSDGEAIAILREANDSRRLLATLTGLTP